MRRTRKPKVFIGSSSEGLLIARSIERNLEQEACVSVWDCGTFEPGATGIESLLHLVDDCDFGVFVLSPDDRVVSRDREFHCPRDNVVFELGLFVGRLGRERTFIIYDKEAPPKLPSDLAGVTAIVFSGTRFSQNRVSALSPVADRIRERMMMTVTPREVDLLKAFISFIPPETKPGDSYSMILSRRFDAISAEVRKLETRGDVDLLLEIKQRLAEYFEYSGQYQWGVEFGRRYVRLLSELGEETESLWCQVKLVGYLLILDGDHRAGRRELSEAASKVESWTEARKLPELLFYCYRYLAVSYLRDSDGGDITRAETFLLRAIDQIRLLPAGSRKRLELEARILGNQGNFALESNRTDQALEFYRESLKLHEEIEDDEHVGIANLQIAQACLRAQPPNLDCLGNIEKAQAVFIRLGWIEGQARVLEWFAVRSEFLASRSASTDQAQSHLAAAMTTAKESRALFHRIRNQPGVQRIETLITRISGSQPLFGKLP